MKFIDRGMETYKNVVVTEFLGHLLAEIGVNLFVQHWQVDDKLCMSWCYSTNLQIGCSCVQFQGCRHRGEPI